MRDDLDLPEGIVSEVPNGTYLTRSLTTAFSRLPSELKDAWIWWGVPTPAGRNIGLSNIVEDAPRDVCWNSRQKTLAMLDSMSARNRAKVHGAQRSGRKVVGAIYKRTRRDEYGEKKTRAEVRFDEVAGCLRTPAGGSSR